MELRCPCSCGEWDQRAFKGPFQQLRCYRQTRACHPRAEGPPAMQHLPPAATTEARKAHRQAGAREPGRQPPSPCSPAQWRGRAPALPGGAPSLTPGRPPRRGPTAARFEFAVAGRGGRASAARAGEGVGGRLRGGCRGGAGWRRDRTVRRRPCSRGLLPLHAFRPWP